MKKTFYLAAAAALLMASSVAHAGGFSFEIDGQRIHIDAPRHCNSLSCISVTNNGSPINMRKLNPKGKKSDDDDDVASNAPTAKQPTPPAPAQAQTPAPVASNAPPAPPAPPPPAATYAPPPAAATTYAPPASPPAPAADATRERLSGLPASATRTPPPAPSANPAPVANAAPASQPVVANPPPAQQASSAPNNPPPLPADAAAAPGTPIGLWQTADNKGNVRIEQCGANLCGYAEKTNERILINMKASGEKWTGRIHDPDSGSNYDSIIAMKGPNLLNVKGCAFGGLFCGGQTWKRIS